MKKILLAIFMLLSFAAVSQAQTKEEAAKEIIGYFNKGNYAALWDKYVHPKTKKSTEALLETFKAYPSDSLDRTLDTMHGIKGEEIKTMTPKEYFIKTTKHDNDFIRRWEETDKVIIKIDVSNPFVFVRWQQGDLKETLTLVNENNKWYIAPGISFTK